jgi:hypothetical protein
LGPPEIFSPAHQAHFPDIGFAVTMACSDR